MESSIRTEELEPARIEPESFEPTRKPPSADGATAAVHPSMISSIREQCSACGAAMASDQRYCVECGERNGPARVPLTNDPAQRTQQAPAARNLPRRPRASANSTLIAGVGLLLLAMGIGVLIGRSGANTSVKSPPAQIVTVAGAGAATSSPAATAPTSSPAATPTSKSAKTPAATTAKPVKKAPTTPLPKAVKVGSKGHGPGYQNGHFTGNFFGE